MNRNKLLPMFLAVALLILAAAPANAIMFRTTPDQLVDKADIIVRGTVTRAQVLPGAVHGEIDTHVSVRVDQQIKGEAPEVIELTLPGGKLDDSFMYVTDYPDFETGQEVVLFLNENSERIVGQIQGKFTIAQQRILEMDLDADDFIGSLENLQQGLPALVDLDGPFEPVSMAEGILNRLGDFKFGYEGFRWDKNNVSIYINENSSETTGEGAAVQKGMNAWTAAPSKFSFNYAGTHTRSYSTQNFKNEAMWNNGSMGDAIAYAQCWGDYSNYIVECDLVFINDKSYKWTTNDNPTNAQMDVQNIATHEFGHFLMLLDLYKDGDWEKTMYGYAGTSEVYKRTLHQDDKDGIAYIYGSGPGDDDDDDDDDASDDDDDASDDDDDDASDDDDSGDDDDSDDDEFDENAQSCSDLMDRIYNDCDFDLVVNGDSVSGSEAHDLCEEDNGPWECIFSCANHDLVDDCSSFSDCVKSKCDVTLDGGSSGGDDDDDSGGSSCGF